MFGDLHKFYRMETTWEPLTKDNSKRVFTNGFLRSFLTREKIIGTDVSDLKELTSK